MKPFTEQDFTRVFETLKSALTKKDWNYHEIPGENAIISNATGEDFPINYIFRIDSERSGVVFKTDTIANFDKDRREIGAIATCIANHSLVYGHFDFDLATGNLHYTLFDSLFDSNVGEDFFLNIMSAAISVADRYNDRFLLLSKGLITIMDFSKLE